MLASIGPTPAGVAARECHDRRLAIVEARKGLEAQFIEQMQGLTGLRPPPGPRRVSSGALALLGLGPSRWLAIAPSDAAAAIEALERAVSGSGSFIDQTDGLAVLRIGGPRARETFAKGLPIDLDASAFAIDDVAVSAVAHIGVTIWRLDDAPTFEIAAPRSYAGAFAHWLQESAAEFGLEVAPT
jgi:heterotetrameric sarcosine oxidase gamma subunit